MSAIVVLGGADGSIGTIRAAQAIGLHTICVDVRTDAPGAIAADELVNISTRNRDALAGVLAPMRDVDAVVSPASDVNLPTQYALAQVLNLPQGLSDAAVRASVDKGYFRSVCDRLALPGPSYVQGTAAEVTCRAIGLAPVMMVKPTDSSGSRGVRRVENPAELADAVGRAAEISPSGIVIVEEFITGSDYTAEAIVVDGKVALVGVSERRLTPPPYFVTTEHRMPARAIEPGALHTTLDILCQALDYRWGALNVDLIQAHDGRLIVVEWGARLGGNGMAELLRLSTGVDATEAYVRMALGESVDVSPRFERHAGMRILDATHEGKLTAVDGLAEAWQVDGVADIVLAVTPGEHVMPYTRAGAKLGYVLVHGVSPDSVTHSLDAVASLLRFTIEERP